MEHVEIHFTNLDSSQAIKDVIFKKASKIDRKLKTNSHQIWNCSIENRDQVVSIKLDFKGHHYFVSGQCDNLYKSIDDAVEKMLTKIERDHHNT